MKTLFGNQKWFGLTFVTLLILFLGTLGNSFGEKNVGEPRTVRLFYLLPNDRPYRADVVEAMKTGILEVQSFFAEQMEAHGHGRKTFQIETDDQGDPIVYRVDGKYPDNGYSRGYTEGEIKEAFDNSKNVILIVMDISRDTYSGVAGSGTGGKSRGWVLFYREWDWFTAAHELGHAFGLHHDFRDDAYILSYGRRNRSSASLSACAAEFLAVHPYFNPDIPLENESPPTVKLISPTVYPVGAESVPIRLRVRDDGGLHQVLLFVNTKRALGVSGPEVKACQGLAGETDAVVEFNYDGKTPSDRVFSGSPIYTSFSDPLRHTIYVVAVDSDGNRTNTFSPISFTLEEGVVQEISPLSERTPEVRDAIIAAVPDASASSGVTALDLAEITSLSMLRKNITSLKADDFDGLSALTHLDLRSNSLTTLPKGIFDGLSSLTYLGLSSNALTTLPEGIFDGLSSLITLDLRSNSLTTLPNGIFDGLNRLDTINLSYNLFMTLPNGIFDGLSSLRYLYLRYNSLTTLPEGIFDGHTTLRELSLGYVGFSLPITVSLEKVGGDQFKAVVPTGAPFDIVLPVSVTNGSITGGATTLTIPAGSVESEPLTITPTPGTTDAVTVDIGTLPGLPSGHNGYILVKSDDLPLVFTEFGGSVFTPVSERTPQVREAIVAAVPGVNSAADVTAAHLAAITHLDIRKKNISALKAGDFSGLSSLGSLNLGGNQLRSLPEGVFSGLTALWELHLYENQLTDLPVGVFSGLTTLRTINMGGNNLTSLREDVFAGLSSLTRLWIDVNKLSSLPENVFSGLSSLQNLSLSNNQLSSLPENVFSGLSSLVVLYLGKNELKSLPSDVFSGLSLLSTLHLFKNQLRELPDGVFSGLPNLTSLFMGDNVVAPLPITVSLQKVADGQFKAVAPTGAPLDIVLPLSVENGTINGGATPITISAGSMESEVLTVARPTDTIWSVTVDIGTLPSLPVNHRGYSLVKSADLPLEVIEGEVGPEIWSGTITVGTWGNAFGNGNATGYGYDKRNNAGSITNPTFTYRGTTYTIEGFGFAKVGNNPAHKYVLTISPGFPACDKKILGFVRNLQLSDALNGSAYGSQTYIWQGRWAVWAPIGKKWSYTLAFQPTVPDAPKLATTYEGTQVMLSWTIPCDGGIDITSLEYQQKTGNGAFGAWIPIPNSASDEVNAASYTVTNVNNPSESTFEVRAFNALGVGEVSHEASAIEPPTPVCDRTPQVRDAIVNTIIRNEIPDVSICDDVTPAHLVTINGLFLGHAGISALKPGDFSGLSTLERLNLPGNQLSSLPEGIFDGLVALTSLRLYGNAVNPLPLTVSLEKGADGQFKAVAPTGTPFDIVLPISVTDGTITGGATTITIPKGSTESELLTMTRTPGTTAAVTVDIGTLPGLPSNHNGYTLVKSTDLPLTFTAPSETTLMAIKGTITNEDGTLADAGLAVTVTIGSDTKTAVSETGGGYSVIFLATQGVVATTGDTVTVEVSNPNTGATTGRTIQLSPEQISVKQATIDLQFSPSEREYRLSLPAGISFIHVPLKVTAVEGALKTLESVGDLYDALGGASTVSLLITHDPQTGRWVGYFDTGDRGTSADKRLTDDLGIIAVMTAPASVLLFGDALGTNGRSAITLHPDINLVGIPLNDSRITRVSDLLALEGVKDNVTLTIVSDNGEIKLTESKGDSGDIPVTGGQSFILVVQRTATVEISGVGWSNVSDTAVAPLVALRGRAVTDTTPVLAVTGSILPPVGGAALPIVGGASLPRFGGPDFAVTVKNLSTGIVDTAMTDGEGAGYRFTFVDVETGRAAQVGDILELTAQSPDPLIGVPPVRHTVMDEDVKRSWISLDDLVAYEIPAKTELLVNYPNPFNPETWIPYRLAKDAFVTVTIYDAVGRVVRDMAVGHRIAAVYESRQKAIYWDGRTEFGEQVASGIYFYTLTAGDYSATRKMVILK